MSIVRAGRWPYCPHSRGLGMAKNVVVLVVCCASLLVFEREKPILSLFTNNIHVDDVILSLSLRHSVYMMPHATQPSYLRSWSSYSQKDKQRLYIVLYPRDSTYTSAGTCDAYHWAVVVGPQTASRTGGGTRYHAAHTSSSFICEKSTRVLTYEENDVVGNARANTILVRVAIAKVLDPARVADVLRSLPPRAHDECDTCLSWVRRAFDAVHNESGCLKSYLKPRDWNDVERCAREYCKAKRQQRRSAAVDHLQQADSISTFNFWEDRETAR